MVSRGAIRRSAESKQNPKEIFMNKDQVKGRVKEGKGKVKEVAGKAMGNKTMETKGKVEKTAGKAQAAYGDLKEDIEDDMEDDRKYD
jgi:uncharacterized protein YjbJ (UPF0337 family)